MLLAQQERLGLQDLVAKHLPGFPHGDTPTTLVDQFEDLPLDFAPGERIGESLAE